MRAPRGVFANETALGAQTVAIGTQIVSPLLSRCRKNARTIPLRLTSAAVALAPEPPQSSWSVFPLLGTRLAL